MILLPLLAAAALAQPHAGVLLGAAASLERPTASDAVAPLGGLVLGWGLAGDGPVLWRPELSFRLNPDILTIPWGLGGCALTRRPVALGGCAHVGTNLFSYPQLPAADLGFAAEFDAAEHLWLGLRLGGAWVEPSRYKCGNCAQPARPWADGALVLGWRGG